MRQGRGKGPATAGARAGARVACPLANSSWPRAIRDRGRDRAAAAGRRPVGEGTLRGSAVRHRRAPGRRPLPFFSKKKCTELEI